MSPINLRIQRATLIICFFMFYPFRDECELKVGQPSSYSTKLSKPGVLEIVNNNKSLAEPSSDIWNLLAHLGPAKLNFNNLLKI